MKVKVEMKPNELFVGAWVLDGTKIAQVTGVTCDGNIETTANEHSNIEQVESIPLTPERLEKNGFTKNTEENKLSGVVGETFEGLYNIPNILHPSFMLEKRSDAYTVTDHCLLRIKYVHELQAALRLCKIEKEIEL